MLHSGSELVVPSCKSNGNDACITRGVGTGPADPAAAGPMFRR